MNLNNLSMNYKIVFGISTVTILTLIFKYIKNLLNPDKSLSEGQVGGVNQIISNRYADDMTSINQNDFLSLSQITTKLINDRQEDKTHTKNMVNILNELYDKLGEFNHIYQERMFENLIPSQIRKTIIHLSSINLEGEPPDKFRIASYTTSGLRGFKNVINFKLLEAQIPYVPHNIYSGDGNSNKLGFGGQDGVTILEVTIQEATYTIHNLINTINKGSASGVTFKYDNRTHFISVKGSTDGDVYIRPKAYPLFKRLGFVSDLVLSGSYQEAPGLPDLSIHYIDILYKGNSPSADTLTNDASILKRIPLNGQPGDIIYYTAPVSDYHSQELYHPDATANIHELTFNFKRHDGTEYDFKGLHYDLKIEITELVEPTLLNELTEHRERDKQRFLDNEGSNELDTMYSK